MFLKKIISLKGSKISLEDFHQLYEEHNEFVRASVYWMVRDESVDDIVQETFLRAWKNIRKFKGESSFKTWIYRVAMNVTYDTLKKKKEEIVFEENLKEGHHVNVELEDLITKGLMTLKKNHREVFILYYKFGYNNEEISGLVGIPKGTVKSRLHYAREKFSKFLKDSGVQYE